MVDVRPVPGRRIGCAVQLSPGCALDARCADRSLRHRPPGARTPGPPGPPDPRTARTPGPPGPSRDPRLRETAD